MLICLHKIKKAGKFCHKLLLIATFLNIDIKQHSNTLYKLICIGLVKQFLFNWFIIQQIGPRLGQKRYTNLAFWHLIFYNEITPHLIILSIMSKIKRTYLKKKRDLIMKWIFLSSSPRTLYTHKKNVFTTDVTNISQQTFSIF